MAAAFVLGAAMDATAAGAPARVGGSVAVLAPQVLAPGLVPVGRVTGALESALGRHGFRVLPAAEVDAVLTKHRVRYTGGVSAEIATILGSETGADGVLIVSVDDWDSAQPPRVALACRWVGANASAPVLWAGEAAHHGGEHPGAFDLGVVADVQTLLDRGADELAASMASAREGHAAGRDLHGVERRFRPRSFSMNVAKLRSEAHDAVPRIAVLPFIVEGMRRELGEIVAGRFVQYLAGVEGLEVVEPGVVRQALLEARVIQQGGVSLPQVDALRALLDVDFVVTGEVTDYEIAGEAPRSPAVGFSAWAIDARTRQAAWSSVSFARGDDGFRLFETRHVRSGVRLASELVRGVVGEFVTRTEEIRSENPPVSNKEGNQ